MTVATEAKLAREAEIPYAAIAMVTDYDCWHEEFGPVDVASVLKVAHENAARANALVRRVLTDFPAEHEPCRAGSDRALDGAIMTAPAASRSGAARQARRRRGAGVETRRVTVEPDRCIRSRCERGPPHDGVARRPRAGRRRRQQIAPKLCFNWARAGRARPMFSDFCVALRPRGCSSWPHFAS